MSKRLPGNVLRRTVEPHTDANLRDLMIAVRDVGEANMIDLGAVSGTVTIDFRKAQIYKITLSGNVTLAFSGFSAGRSYFLVIEQGAGAYTVTWPANTAWPGAGEVPETSTTAGAIDIVTFIAMDLGTPMLYGVGQADFSA